MEAVEICLVGSSCIVAALGGAVPLIRDQVAHSRDLVAVLGHAVATERGIDEIGGIRLGGVGRCTVARCGSDGVEIDQIRVGLGPLRIGACRHPSSLSPPLLARRALRRGYEVLRVLRQIS